MNRHFPVLHFNCSSAVFLYDGVNPVQETSGATVLANILTGFGIDEFLARTDVAAGTTSHFLLDALGSAVALADSAGAVQTEYTYEPFGKTTITGVSSNNPSQYTGRENDGTGLYYYRARYYHPNLQRFIREDPIEFDGGDVNLYAYVENSPNNDVDPFGLRHRTRDPLGGCMSIHGCPPPSPTQKPPKKTKTEPEPKPRECDAECVRKRNEFCREKCGPYFDKHPIPGYTGPRPCVHITCVPGDDPGDWEAEPYKDPFSPEELQKRALDQIIEEMIRNIPRFPSK